VHNIRKAHSKRCKSMNTGFPESVSDEANSQQVLEQRSNDYPKSVVRKCGASLDFYDVVSKVDSVAKFDRYYEDSAEFNELRSKLRNEVLQSLWIALGISLGLSGIAIVVS
jgi:hypothetical protein